jgi:hypothetical protein
MNDWTTAHGAENQWYRRTGLVSLFVGATDAGTWSSGTSLGWHWAIYFSSTLLAEGSTDSASSSKSAADQAADVVTDRVKRLVGTLDIRNAAGAL